MNKILQEDFDLAPCMVAGYESFMNGLPGLAMLKMDGLTISVKYIDGKLIAAETRGNGIIGENVLHTANSFVKLPKEIPYKDEVVIDEKLSWRFIIILILKS